MNISRKLRSVIVSIGLVTLGSVGGVTDAAAYVMSFSVYSTGATNTSANKLYVYETVSDNSSCYSHSSYRTSLSIRSPSGRTSAAQATGLYVNGSIAINGEYGTYRSGVSGTYTCGCTGLNLGFGFDVPMSITEAKTYYQDPSRSGAVGCYYPELACAYGTPTCGVGHNTLALYSTAQGCPYYAGAIYGVLRINGGAPICTLGVSYPAYGPGPCS